MASMKNADSNVSRAQLMTPVIHPCARRRAHSAAGRCGAYRSTRRSSSRPATNWEIGTFGLPQLSDEDAVRRYCRALAESRRAGLVEAAVVESWSGPGCHAFMREAGKARVHIHRNARDSGRPEILGVEPSWPESSH